ncbi:DUF3862 domain-containing protein [Streptococcus alactolyticus]|uniref:DUF3862 domain-containing protein n=1 Tax=Streptococcus alactolyticus TaxID=29389 RepID=UPI003D0715FE
MKKIGLLGLTLLSVATLSACSSSKTDNKNTSSSSSVEQTTSSTSETIASSTSVDETKKAVRAVYDSVVVGDLMNNGEGGTTKDTVVNAYGNPASTSTTSINGMNVEQVTWIGNGNATGITVSIQFINNNATSKMISGFQFSRDSKIGLTEFNNLTTGTSYNDVVNTLGEPDTTSESLISGSKSVTANWITGIKGNVGANFVLQFTNDSLTSKSQSGLTD